MLGTRVVLSLGGSARRARQSQPQEPNGSLGSRRGHRPGPPRARATHRRVPRVSSKRDPRGFILASLLRPLQFPVPRETRRPVLSRGVVVAT